MRLVSPPRLPPTADPRWVKALFLAPAVVGSFAALVVLGQTSGFRTGLRRWLGRPAGPDLDALRTSIVGQPKRRLTARFGPPPAAVSAPTVTWYYPVPDADRPTAMAVRFDGDAAVAVEFFHPPA